MCRIAGIVDSYHPPSAEMILLMRDAMQHGGPDDAGIYCDAELRLAFGFRRLSFQDLSPLGQQPMIDDAGEIVLMFNGEIYNFKELRQELLSLGYSFQSTGDTEVILKAYKAWGKECLTRFNGMFAIALLDKRTNTLLLARDHAGIKPLYYFLNNNQIYFASEIRAFKAVNPNWPENPNWKKYFLLFGHLPEPVTTLQGVVPLPKGTALEIQLDTFQILVWKFFQLHYNYSITDSEEAIVKVREVLTKSVERHLISDAPVGLFLSGGLDSSLLTVLAKRFIPNNLRTLSITFEDKRYTEEHYQELVIKQTNAHHHSYVVSQRDFQQSLPEILNAMDQPSNDGINSYFICKYAREYGLKAALSGIGSDELFGGYPSFNRSRRLAKLSWIPRFMFHAARLSPDNRLKKISFLGEPSALGEYLFNRGFFTPKQVAELLDCTESEVNDCLISFQKRVPHFTKKLDPTERVSYLENNFYLQNQLLKDTDFMSMWHGLEVRVPFLDKELIELVYSIAPNIRYRPAQFKYLLVQAFIDVLPEEIWNRTKQGFTFPFDDWMRHIDFNMNGEDKLKTQFLAGKIHWSRYWSYHLSKR